MKFTLVALFLTVIMNSSGMPQGGNAPHHGAPQYGGPQQGYGNVPQNVPLPQYNGPQQGYGNVPQHGNPQGFGQQGYPQNLPTHGGNVGGNRHVGGYKDHGY